MGCLVRRSVAEGVGSEAHGPGLFERDPDVT